MRTTEAVISAGNDPDKQTPQRVGIQSVEVGFSLLDALASSGGPLMLRDLAAAAGMNAAKAHRYLVSFQRLALVAQDAGTTRYDLGPAALKLGLASLARLDSVKLARQRLGPLTEKIGQTTALAVWGNHGPTIVHWEDSPQAFTSSLRLGDVMPLLSSATGLCFSAYLTTPDIVSISKNAPQNRLAQLLKEELARSQKSIRPDVPSNMTELAARLDDVRRHGIARVVDSLLPGAAGFCAPVFDADGHLALGIVTLGTLATFDPDLDGAVATQLKEAARRLSSDLGFTWPRDNFNT